METIAPKDCVFAFCIPTTLAEYDAYPSFSGESLFLDKGLTSRWKYNAEIVEPAARLKKILKKQGVAYREAATWRSFLDLCRTNSGGLVVLFAHWAQKGIEFHDQVCGIEQFLSEFPQDFHGALDFNVCHPDDLIRGLNERMPALSLRYHVGVQASPVLWLHYYLLFISLLGSRSMNYYEASNKTMSELSRLLK